MGAELGKAFRRDRVGQLQALAVIAEAPVLARRLWWILMPPSSLRNRESTFASGAGAPMRVRLPSTRLPEISYQTRSSRPVSDAWSAWKGLVSAASPCSASQARSAACSASLVPGASPVTSSPKPSTASGAAGASSMYSSR